MTSRSRKTRKGEVRLTISGVQPHLTALLTALITCVGWLGLSSLPAWATAGTVTEFPVPGGEPSVITAGPDGALWFTEGTGDIGCITPSGTITEFRIKTKNSQPIGRRSTGSAGTGPWCMTS